MMRVIISCGGTGGHLAPGIALAEGLMARGHTCWLLISRKKVDARLVQKYPHLAFVKVRGAPFTFHPLGLVRFLFDQVGGFLSSLRLIRRLQPDLVVGFGGFSSAGISMAAALRKVPFALHESNRVPGRTVRVLSRLGPARIYLPPGVQLGRRARDRIRFFGTPVRKEMQRLSAQKARAILGIDEHAKLLVLLGGSQGASILNEWVRQNIDSLAAEGVSVYCVTGLNKGAEQVEERRSRTGAMVKFWFVPFTDQMPEILSAADLVVSRAGAGTLAELVRCRAPSILVPYPFAADNHQRANARFFEQQGGGLVLEQGFLQDLRGEVLEVIFNDWLLQKFRANLQRMDRENSLGLIIDDLEQISEAPREGGSFRVLELA